MYTQKFVDAWSRSLLSINCWSIVFCVNFGIRNRTRPTRKWNKQVSKVMLQEAASPSYHHSWRRMHSSGLDLHLIHGSLCVCWTQRWAMQKRLNQSRCVSPSNHVLTRVCSANGISTGSAFFHTAHSCALQTDRQIQRHTNHATCDICSNRSHLCTTCKRYTAYK